MKTIPARNLTLLSLKEKISRFYDIGSPYYLQVFGKHIHDGYYLTGHESREQAQDNLVRFLVEKAQIKPGSTILDVGSGVGGSSIWLAQYLKAQTTGITISQVQLDISRKLAQRQNVSSQFLLMDADEIQFTKRFNYIWIVAALTHLKDPEKFFKSSNKLLYSQGRLIIYDWTLGENVADSKSDPEVTSVIDGMVLSGLYTVSVYLKWLSESGYRNIYSEDITEHTIQTWDGILSLIREPRIWRLILQSTSAERKEVLTFYHGVRGIKRAMSKGKVRSTAIIAEKIN